jgi:small-conductance mechanosensitive channel
MDKFISFVQSQVATIANMQGLAQLLILAVCAAGAWFFHRYTQSLVDQKLGSEEKKGLRRVALRGAERIVFPISMLLLVAIGKFALNQLEIKTALLNIALPLLLSLAAIRISVYAIRRAFTPGPAIRAWEGIISTLAWSIVALHLLGWLPDVLQALDGPAIKLGTERFSLLTSIKLLLSVALFVVLANWLSRFIDMRASRSVHISASMRVVLTKFSRFFLYSLAILIALDTVGIDLTTLTVFGGALGVGIGFGLQRIVSNFISGFILLFDRSIKPGDVISIGERFGWVVALHARYIVVKDRDGVETLIPNENLITSEVTNWSYSDRQVRVKLPVQVSYDSDPEFAMKLMVEACENNERVLKNPAPQSRLLAFGDNGINLELRIWLNDPEKGVGAVKTDVNLGIWKRFKQHGISIPFPQRDVRIISGQTK